MSPRAPKSTTLFPTIRDPLDSVRVSYVVDVPTGVTRGTRAAKHAPTRIFSVVHHAKRGWGVEDGRFEHAEFPEGGDVATKRRMQAARRAYEGLATAGTIPDGVPGYLVVEYPGRTPDESLAMRSHPGPRSFAELRDAVREAHAAKEARFGPTVYQGRSHRAFRGASDVAHVQEFRDGFRVWVPAKHAFVGDGDLQPFKTMAAAVDHLDAVKAGRKSAATKAPAQRSLFIAERFTDAPSTHGEEARPTHRARPKDAISDPPDGPRRRRRDVRSEHAEAAERERARERQERV